MIFLPHETVANNRADIKLDVLFAEVADELLETFASKELRPDAWDLPGLREAVNRQFGIALAQDVLSGNRETLTERVAEILQAAYDAKSTAVGPEMMRQLERTVLLSVIDAK